MTEHWYTFHTKPNAEYQVAQTLRQRGLEVFLPEVKAPRSRRRRKMKPFFPSYLFAKVDLKAIGISKLRWVPGLNRLVAFGDQPIPVPEEIIEYILDNLEALQAQGGLPTHNFKPGDTVRITSGPFEGMEAIFDQGTTSAERVQVLLEILGRASRMEIDPDQLETAADSDDSEPKRPRRTRGHGRRISNAGN